MGLSVWLALATVGFVLLRAELEEQSSSMEHLTSQVVEWLGRTRKTQTAQARIPLGIGLDDPIFVALGDDEFLQVGHVANIDGTRERDPLVISEVEVVIYDSARTHFPDGFQLEYHTTPMDLNWVVRMLIPPERQEEIARLVRKEWELNADIITEELRPVLREGMSRVVQVVESELPRIIARHREDFRDLGKRFEDDILREDLLPLAKDEVFPVIQEEMQPLTMEIASTLWDRVSLVSFTWRYLYDASSLSDGQAVQAEFQRFIDQEAIPELESRSDEFIAVTRTVMQRMMDNERVQATMQDSIARVVEDPQLQEILWKIIREASIENQHLRREIDDWLASRATRAAMRIASDGMELMVRGVGDLVFGTREGGVTPEFARILRSQILRKDRRWFMMVPVADVQDGSAIPIRIAETPMLYPQKFSGEAQSPLTPYRRRSQPAEEEAAADSETSRMDGSDVQ